MGVIDVPDDRREQDEWLEQLRAKYDGPPPIPPDVAEDEARRDFGLEATARYADYVYHDGGEARLIPRPLSSSVTGRAFSSSRSSLRRVSGNGKSSNGAKSPGEGAAT